MKKILVEEKYILEYIKDMINDLKIKTLTVDNAKYHHNTNYSDAPSICRTGILTMQDLKNRGIKNYTDEFLNSMDDTNSHVNGIDSVSLAVMGLQDLYKDELEYNPYSPNQVDFLVSSDVKAGRSSVNYGNEFLASKSISIDKLRSVDIRILKLIESSEKKVSINKYALQNIIEKYNYLKDIAIAMRYSNLDIPLREMSHDSLMIDIDKLATVPKLLIKNKK